MQRSTRFLTLAAGALALTMSTGCSGSSSSNAPAPAPPPNLSPVDVNFGAGGVILSDPSSGEDDTQIIVDDGTNLYVVGYDSSNGTGDTQWRIESYAMADGAVNTTFNSTGVVTTNPSSGDDQPAAAVVVGTALFVVGWDESPGTGNTQWRIEKRVLSTGALDTTFNTTGIVASNVGTGDDQPTAVVADATHLYIAGYDSPGTGNTQWRIEKRSLSTGALETTTFGSATGIVTTNPSADEDEIEHLVHDGSALYVAGWDETNGSGNSAWRIEKRSMSTGALVTSFNSTGVVTGNPSAGLDRPALIAHDGTDLFIGGFDAQGGGFDLQCRLEKRSMSTGALVAAFGTGGVITANTSTTPGIEVCGVFYDGGELYTGGASQGGGNAWRIEQRDPTTGALDATFGIGGVLTNDPSAQDDEPSWVVFSATHIFFSGNDRVGGASNAQWRIQKHTR